MNTFILLLDTASNKVLCNGENSTIATSTSMGFCNVIMQCFIAYNPESLQINYDDANKFYDVINNWKIVETNTCDNDFLDLRNKVLIRKNCHKELYQFCDYLTLFASDNVFLTNNISFLIDQLNKCRIENNYFTDPIYNYAECANCDPKFAFQELQLLVESQGQRKNRIMSLYIKYRDLLNLSPLTSLSDIIDQAKNELLHNSYV